MLLVGKNAWPHKPIGRARGKLAHRVCQQGQHLDVFVCAFELRDILLCFNIRPVLVGKFLDLNVAVVAENEFLKFFA